MIHHSPHPLARTVAAARRRGRVRARRFAAVVVVGVLLAATGCSGSSEQSGPATTESSIAGSSTTSTSAVTSTTLAPTTTQPAPPAAPVDAPYDNTIAELACTLLAPEEIEGQFGGPVAAPVPVDPYCSWRIGVDGFVALTALANQSVGRLRAFPGLSASGVPDLGDGAFFAVNKTLYVGMGPTTYVLQFQRGAEWVDSNQPRLVALAQVMLDRLGFVPPPPPPEPIVPDPDNPEVTEPPPPTTTTTRPRPPAIGPVAPVTRPVAPLDPKRVLTPDEPLRIWVGGDSIAGGPAWAVGEAARPLGASVLTEFQVGTGLSRPDFFDWYRHLNAVADAYDPEIMILLFGGNDIQPLQLPDGSTVGYGDPAWSTEYRRRVAAIMDTLAVRGRQLIWVGTPPMEAPDYNAQMAELNGIYSTEAAARANWVTYFDAWTMFSPPGELGVFTRTLPDAAGQPQSVRFDDIHFDVAGSRLLAGALLESVRAVSSLPPG